MICVICVICVICDIVNVIILSYECDILNVTMDSDSDDDISVFGGFPDAGADVGAEGDDGDDGDLPDWPDNESDFSVSTVGSDDLDDFYDDPPAAAAGGPVAEEAVLANPVFSANLHDVTINAFEEEIGPHHKLKEGAKEIAYFNLLFRPHLFTHIVEETNRYATQQQALHGVDPHWTETSVEEMRAYVGLNVWMGIHILPQTHMYWSTDDFVGVPGIIKTMTRDRFNKLSQYLHVSNNQYQRRRGEPGYDPLYKVREVMESLDLSFRKYYRPHREMSIDEAMVAFKGRSFLKQYLPNKPIKWGFKVWTLADSHTGYVLNFLPYTGKRLAPSQNGLGYDVVTGLAEPYLNKNYHLFFDNLFSGLPLMDFLMDNGTYACGTFRKNRKGIPDAIKNPRKLTEGESVKLQKDNVVVCVWHDKKDVFVVSTQSNPVDDEVTRKSKTGEQRIVRCPQAIKTYNSYMGGVDLADQKRSYYPVGRDSKKFWRYLFWYMVNTALINAHIIYFGSHVPAQKKHAKVGHLEFRMRVARQLIDGFTNRKRKATAAPTENGADAPAANIAHLPGHKLVHAPDGERNKVCVNCKLAGRKTAKGKRTPESIWRCALCQVALCKTVCYIEYHNRVPH